MTLVNKSNSTRLEAILSKEVEDLSTPLVNRHTHKLTGEGSKGKNNENRPLDSAKRLGVSSTGKKVLVENTPTPFLVKKFAKFSTRDDEADCVYDFPINKKTVADSRRVIPNTPAVHMVKSNNNQTCNPNSYARRIKKKLLNVNDNMNDEELPGSDIPIELVPVNNSINTGSKNGKKKDGPKVSNLFKPKQVLDAISAKGSANVSDDRGGCDWSYETLLKRERRRKNPLVARLSEVERMINEKSGHESTKNETAGQQTTNQLESINEQAMNSSGGDASSNISHSESSTSPILVRRNTKVASSGGNMLSAHTPRGVTFTASQANFTPTHFEGGFNDSLTKVTRHAFDLTNKTIEIYVSQPSQAPLTKSLSHDSLMNIDESLVEKILFDGLDVHAFERKNEHAAKFFDAVERSQTQAIKKFKSRSVSAGNRPTAKSPQDRVFKLAKSKKSSDTHRRFFPSTTKRVFNLTHLDLTKRHLEIMKKVVVDINNAESQRFESAKDTELVTCFMHKRFSANSTHIIIDFNKFFDPDKARDILTLNKKCLLTLAVLSSCKITRIEWLKHSWRYSKWREESQFLLESYLESEIEAYDPTDDFDVKLIRLIDNVKRNKMEKFFSAYKNIYIIDQENDDEQQDDEFDATVNMMHETVEGEENYDEEDDNDDDEFELVATSRSGGKKSKLFNATTNTSVNIFRTKNSTYNLLDEILRKCGAHKASRARCAELFIVVDRTTHDFNLDDTEIERERSHFFQKIDEITPHVRRKEGVPVISSNWILDSLMRFEVYEPTEYEIERIMPKRNSDC